MRRDFIGLGKGLSLDDYDLFLAERVRTGIWENAAVL